MGNTYSRIPVGCFFVWSFVVLFLSCVYVCDVFLLRRSAMDRRIQVRIYKEYLFTIFCLKVPCASNGFDSRVSSNQNDETPSRNSLMYMSKANLPIAVNL